MRIRTGSLWIALAFAAGCAEESKHASVAYVPSPPGSVSDSQTQAKSALPVSATERGNAEGQTTLIAIQQGTPPPKATPRKIIYTADVSVVVEDFPIAADAIAALVKRFDGYIADTDVVGSPGANRRATWKVRVPVARFDSFLDSVSKLGELQRRQVHSQDITEEFFDLEARVENKKVEEQRLVKLLTENTGKLEEILSVERELSRVREEIERMEGRVRLLADLSDLTTVTILAEERINYVPATAPTFATRAARTFEGSTENLVKSIQNLALAAISVVPWLPVWFVAGGAAWLALRRFRRRPVAHPARPDAA